MSRIENEFRGNPETLPNDKRLLKIIGDAARWGLLSQEEKRKLRLCLPLWAAHAALCQLNTFVIFPTSFALTASNENPAFLGLNLIPGILRVGSIFAVEKLSNVRFSNLSKGIAFSPILGGGSAMPVEIASILGTPYAETLTGRIKEGLTVLREKFSRRSGF